MIEPLADMEPVKKPDLDGDTSRLEQFRQANASLALEGMVVNDTDRAIQERIARGELTPDEAVALYLQHAQRGTK